MNRQAVIGIVFVIILIIIGWQVYGMFGGRSSSPTIQPAPTRVPAGQMSLEAPGGAKTTAPANPAVAAQNNNFAMPQAGLPAAQNTQIQPASVLPNDLLRQQQQTQNKYISMVNDLQLLRVQRDIAETNQAIAAAELAKVTAEKGISDALTRPTQFAGTFNLPEGLPNQQKGLVVPAQAPAEVPYTIVSVSMQGERWSALIDYQGKLFSVTVGDVLPIDNSKVVSIGRNGVILRRDGKNRRISIVSSSI